MYGHEGQLEAAGEKAEHQQHIGTMAEGFGQRLPDRLRRRGRRAGCGRRRARRHQRKRQRQDQHQQRGQRHQRGLPAIGFDQDGAER
jgi:hypothetical protein